MNRECLITWWHEISSMRCVSHQRAKTLLTRACSPLAPKNDCWQISKFNLLCDHRGRRLQAGLISPLSVAAVPSISPDNLPNSFICSSSTASPMAVGRARSWAGRYSTSIERHSRSRWGPELSPVWIRTTRHSMLASIFLLRLSEWEEWRHYTPHVKITNPRKNKKNLPRPAIFPRNEPNDHR